MTDGKYKAQKAYRKRNAGKFVKVAVDCNAEFANEFKNALNIVARTQAGVFKDAMQQIIDEAKKKHNNKDA